MDAVIRNAHRSLQSTERTQRGPFRRTRREERRGSEEVKSHPLMSSASCMLSMRKTNLQEVLLERRNKALAKRVMNVKSFCDPNGKDLEDYRRHQRMVQVRQEFHHYGGAAAAPPPKDVVPLFSRPSRPRVAQSLSESNLHHLNALLCPWDLPQAHRQNSKAEEVVVAIHSTSGQTPMAVVPEETEKENENEEVPTEDLQLKPPASHSAPSLNAPATSSSPMAQMTPVATETPATETTPEALPTLPALPVLSTPTPATSFNGGLAPLSTFNGGLAPLSTQSSPNFTLPTTTANNDQTVSETAAVSPIPDTTVQKEATSISDFAVTDVSPSQNDVSGPTLTPSTGNVESTTQPEQQAPADRHADPFGEMGMFDKPPEFKTKRRRERPAD